MKINRKVRKVFSQRNVKDCLAFATFARTFAISAVKAAVPLALLLVSAQIVRPQNAPEVYKVDPPSWWTRSSVNPVRLLVHGKNLKGARVEVTGSGVRLVG